MASHLDDPLWTELVDRLTAASPEFARRWDTHDVTSPPIAVKRFRNPIVGELRLHAIKLWLARSGVAQLTAYSPADEQTRLRFERLAERVPTLVAARAS